MISPINRTLKYWDFFTWLVESQATDIKLDQLGSMTTGVSVISSSSPIVLLCWVQHVQVKYWSLEWMTRSLSESLPQPGKRHWRYSFTSSLRSGTPQAALRAADFGSGTLKMRVQLWEAHLTSELPCRSIPVAIYVTVVVRFRESAIRIDSPSEDSISILEVDVQ